MDDNELFLLIADGDERAFAELFRKYVPILEPFVYGITKNHSQVNEIVQETFLRLWLSRDKMTGVEQPRSWIYKIASNICYNWLRRQVVERKAAESILHASEDQTNSTLNKVDENQLNRLLQEAIKELPTQRRNIYRMSRDEGLKVQEIADRLGLSTSTVKNTIVSSLKSIREYLAKHGYPVSLIWVFCRLFFKNIFLD